MNRAYYANSVEKFLKENPQTILGILADQHEFELDDGQKLAWKAQIDILRLSLVDIPGHIFFEFSIPRMGKRVDVVLLVKRDYFLLEFKVGEINYPCLCFGTGDGLCLGFKEFP